MKSTALATDSRLANGSSAEFGAGACRLAGGSSAETCRDATTRAASVADDFQFKLNVQRFGVHGSGILPWASLVRSAAMIFAASSVLKEYHWGESSRRTNR